MARAAVLPRRSESGVGAVIGDGYEPIALLGETGGGGATYLVRDRGRGDLAVARLLKRRRDDTSGRPIVAMLRELDGSIPAPGAPCPSCGNALTAWAQRCVRCGARLASPSSLQPLLAATAERYTLLGSLPVYGGGAVAFAIRSDDGAIVALHAREWHDTTRGGDHLELVEAGPLAPPPADLLPSLDTPVASAPPEPAPSEPSVPTPAAAAAPPAPPESPVAPESPESTESAAPAEGDGEGDGDEELHIGEMPTHVMDKAVREGQGQLHEPTRFIRASNLGSGALARHSGTVEGIPVPKVCPMCGTEYETDARFCPKDGTSLRPKGGIDPLIGQTVADRYHILKRIGEGGMGRVYLAEHVRMGRMCAIKVMRSALLNDEEAMARFAREASNAARILHPNVAAVFDYGESEGIVYLVMELVDGEPLSAIIARERALPVARVLDLAKQVTEALIAAHEMGVVHRDLKPDNILVTRRGDREIAKVVDFGIAKAVAESPHEALTRSGLVIGTPEFMSPEQLLGDPVDARTDLYSLGCIVFLMLTGTQAAEAPTREAMLKRRLHELPPHPRAVNRALPPDLDAIVVRLLSSAPADRYAAASEVRAALERVRADGGEPTPIVANAVPRTPPALRFETPMPGPRPPRRRRYWAFGAVGVAAGIAAVGFLAMQQRILPSPIAPPPGAAEARTDSTGVIVPPTSAGSTVVAVPTRPGATPSGSAPQHAPGADATSPLTPPARVDTPATTPVRPSRANEGVYAPLHAYAEALRAEDLARVRQVYTGLSERQSEAIAKIFRETEAVNARAESPEMTEAPNETAIVRFTLVWTVRDPRTGESTTTRTPYRARLARRGNAWVLQELSG